ncbi:tRNA (adenosine(37)-N6)-threonylcarbamoyltransferase complex ATPase subunit type 1 TsaE [Hyunsoonleella aestuarii]|uniref:tRNA threonylcarbamoyladenosine biosynthesis protein TsaE n=1 Tax=Hyunsoonleella aestuarii TaxID=912802 RepID=A0ABP8EDD0_9FLAO|nr:tRNA (adenosine(37)-N6)-threonylcarbamoyltransferase complex ATPase subunit type 1 TsaE [Hyunsoonleella aestuarii]
MEISYSLDSIDDAANWIIKNVKTKTIFLYGEMGAGKTTLIKSIVKVLSSNDEVSSPTFSIVNEYESLNESIYHFDLYRIENIEEAYNFGIEDYIDSNNWIIVEWPNLIESLVDNYDRVFINKNEDNSRTIRLENRRI